MTTLDLALYFNIRTRSLNSLMFNVMQIFGAVWIAVLLDNKKMSSRRARGLVTVAVVAVIVIAGWIGITVWVYKNPLDLTNPPLFDWKDGPFGGFFVLNLIFGMVMVIVRTSHLPIQSSFMVLTGYTVPSDCTLDCLQLHQRSGKARSARGFSQGCSGRRYSLCVRHRSGRFIAVERYLL